MRNKLHRANGDYYHKGSVPDIVASRIQGRVFEARNYFGSFIKIDFYNAAGERAYFRILYCRWKIPDLGEEVLDSEVCNSSDGDSLRFLVGKSIEGLEISESNELRIEFEDGTALIAWPDLLTYDQSDEIAVFVIDNDYYQLSPRMTFYTGEVENPH